MTDPLSLDAGSHNQRFVIAPNSTPHSLHSQIAHSFMPATCATRKLWRMLRSSMISSEPPGMA